LLRLWALRFAPLALARAVPLRDRDALLRLRVDADGLERDDAPEERDEAVRAPLERGEPLALVLAPDPFDDLVPRCVLPEADLLLAIPHPSRSRQSFSAPDTHLYTQQPNLQEFADCLVDGSDLG
jgi:hypothetical protein